MWLSRWFRRPRPADKLRLIIPIYSQFLGWMGGEIYISNLIRLLSALPDDLRPELILMQMSHLWSRLDAFALRLAEYKAVVAIIERNGLPRFMKADLRERLGAAKGLSGGRWSDYLAGIRATFPVLYIETEARFLPNPIFWIPDFQHRCLPHLFEPAEIAQRDTCFAAIAASGKGLILSSDAALADYRRFFPTSSTRDYVWRFHSFIAEDLASTSDSISEFGLPERYYYIANQFWEHKDHATAFRALSKVRAAGRPMEIVCTGCSDDYRNSGHFLSLISILDEAGVKDKVRLLGLVTREQQGAIFRHATAVIQPSQFEGWSTVVEDAKAFGRPIIASDLAVHKEQLGDKGVFFKTGDSDDLARVVLEIWDRMSPQRDSAVEDTARRSTQHLLNAAAAGFLEIIKDQPSSTCFPWHFGASSSTADFWDLACISTGIFEDFFLAANGAIIGFPAGKSSTFRCTIEDNKSENLEIWFGDNLLYTNHEAGASLSLNFKLPASRDIRLLTLRFGGLREPAERNGQLIAGRLANLTLAD